MAEHISMLQKDVKHVEVTGYTLERTVKLMKLTFSRILLMYPEIDITVDQWVIIHLLHKHQTLSQQEIGDLAFKDAPTVTRMLDLLETKKVITRKADKTDKRKYKITLTSLGRQKFEAIQPIVKNFRAEAYDGLSADELEMLEKTLKKIFENLSKQN
jgi:DNA-binding MarR family transcriptional regulator